MRKITDIYEEYKIMPQLQLHQLRVAAVARQVCESLDQDIDTKSVVTACLMHDMGNIIKFNLSYTKQNFPGFLEPQGLEYWQDIQQEYFTKYGEKEHEATIAIIKELRTSSIVLDLAKHVDATYIESIVTGDNFGRKISIYADDRVTPHGIVSIEERNIEAYKRYKDTGRAFDEEKKNFYAKNIFEIEKQIFLQSNIKPEDITDESVAKIIEELKNFEI